MEIFTTITAYHWIALGLLLLTAEVLGTAGFLLGAAVAALGMGLALWLVPDMSVAWQLVIYAIGALAATLLELPVDVAEAVDGDAPVLEDVLADDRFPGDPSPSRLM